MKQGQVYVNGRLLEEPYVQRKDPLHDGFDPEFNWQREYLVRRSDEQRRRSPTVIRGVRCASRRQYSFWGTIGQLGDSRTAGFV